MVRYFFILRSPSFLAAFRNPEAHCVRKIWVLAPLSTCISTKLWLLNSTWMITGGDATDMDADARITL